MNPFRLAKGLFTLLICTVGVAQDSSLFERQIRPILAERCAKCHGGDAKFSDFDLTSRGSLLKGGKHGTDVLPGNPDGSRLYEWVSSGRMPPDRKLDAAGVDAIRQWIAGGAEWPGAERIAIPRARAGLDWWSLQTPRKPAVPELGAQNPIDAFILQKLREKGLDFAPLAGARTLLRRISFDLHGLPPSPEQMSESYDQAVERLLASPHYGERWGRHWLDVMRFGETDGGEHNNERMTAWKYRDYVIDAFNSDKPYDRFLREQIAGDVLAPGDPQGVAATGFLVAGPWDSVTKMINKDENMRKTIRQDELDDMVTTTFATFQGLTVNCARCHDHKFDPIPTRDYYRLTAVFNGAGFGERETATPAQRAAREAAVAPIKKELDAARRKLAAIEDPVRARLLEAKYQAFDRSRAGAPRRIPLNPIWNRNQFAPVTATRFRMAIASLNGGKRPKIDRLELLPAGHVITAWEGAAEPTPDRPAYLRIDLESARTVSEIRWSSDQVTGSRDGSPRVYRFESSTDGEHWTTLCSSLGHENTSEISLPELSEAELTAALPPGAIAQRNEFIKSRDEIQERMNAIPPIASVYAIKPEALTPAYLLDRGSLLTPREEVKPGALSCIRQLPADLDAADEGARRIALANWIADTRNPLTARVIVNRVWYYHFGAGIVNTPSDFGFNGDRPSHPELLDYLATSFIEHGWSLKWLHRQILHSRAYRQSSAFNAKAHAVDASGRLLWRMPLKRMDAETLRDSILSVTGSLNPLRGGPSFLLQSKAEKGSYLHRALDNDGPEVWRRAVYRFVVRGGERVFMDSFDCPDPAVATPQRSESNTAVQSLTLLNNQFVLRQAGLLAGRLEKEAGAGRVEQITRAYDLLFGRKPSEKEISLAVQFLKEQPLALYCRALLNSNEFVYVP